MKKIFSIILITSVFPSVLLSQLYLGPANGSVGSGVIISTDNFTKASYSDTLKFKKVPEHPPIPDLSDPINLPKPTAPEGSNYRIDPTLMGSPDTTQPLLFISFPGLPEGSSFPPDPYIAAGPTHLMLTDNSAFRICEKDGRTVKTINADQWYSNVLFNASAFDPKVIYDHIDKRWVMVWLHQEASIHVSYIFISVSDDSIPLGTWYNWKIPGNTNGDQLVTNWADYQGVGFDKDAIYITTNQFSSGTGSTFQYAKLRIIPKAQLYNNTAGALSWIDFWGIREPLGDLQRYLRPARMYSNSNEYYIVASSRYSTGTFMTLYKVTNPITNPDITAVNVPVTAFTSPPNANQLGGSTTLIETGGSRISNEPVFKDGKLHLAHCIRSGTGGLYSSIRYLTIDVANNTAVDDIAMGADGFWHYYPALALDKNGNVVITYSRSGDTEYIGAFFTTKKTIDTALSGSKTLIAGKGNYVRVGSGRNRWGDYMGAWTDPADENNVWIYTEYTSGTNSYGEYVGGVRFSPLPGASIFVDEKSLDFGVKEIDVNVDTFSVTIRNFGSSQLVISNIDLSSSSFAMISNFSFPIQINTYDSINVFFKFSPKFHGIIYDTIKIYSNDSQKPITKIFLKGQGFKITPAQANLMYGAARSGSDGVLLSVNTSTANSSVIGASGYSEIISLTINPTNKELFAFSGTLLLRVNSTLGDAYVSSRNKITISAIAFDRNGNLYAITSDNKLYKVNPYSGDTTFIANLPTSVTSFTINPKSGEIWASAGASSSIKDQIFKIDKSSGDTIVIGRTGFNQTTNALAFGNDGTLYGARGTLFVNSFLIKIDTINGSGVDIGSLGFKVAKGLAMISDSITSVANEDIYFPYEFRLLQNYPNPFNPSTVITYQVGESNKKGAMGRNVTLKVFDILGREIAKLVDEYKTAGTYKVLFDGSLLPSGVYLLQMKSGSFTDTKKMLLVR